MNKNKLWFRAKTFGWGWYPVSWEGWAVIALYIAAVGVHIRNIDIYIYSGNDILTSLTIPFVINTIFLLIICYCRGEKPRWRWNGK